MRNLFGNSKYIDIRVLSITLQIFLGNPDIKFIFE